MADPLTGGVTDEEYLKALQALNSMGGAGIAVKQPSQVGQTVGRLPKPSQITMPEPPAPEPSYLSRALQGGRNLLSIATTPLVDIPDQWVGNNPFLKAIEGGVEGLTSPLGIGAALFAPLTGGTSLGLTGLGGVAARTGTRLAAEAAVGSLAGGASQAAKAAIPEDWATTRELAGLGAGLAGGIAGVKGIRRVPGFEGAQAFKPFSVKVARDVELEPGGARFGNSAVQPSGSPIRGVPIAPESVDVPDMLYAISPNARKTIEQGRIYTSPVTGLNRSGLGDDVISLFNKDDAEQIAADFKIVNRGLKQSRAELIDTLEKQAARDGWAWAGGAARAKPISGGLAGYQAAGGKTGVFTDIFDDYFKARSLAANADPNLSSALKINPFEFESLDSIRKMSPDISTVAVSKQGLNPLEGQVGAMLTRDDAGSVSNFNFYGDVPFATKMQLMAAEADPAVRQFINTLESARVWSEDPRNANALKSLRSAEAAKRTAIFTERVKQATTPYEMREAQRALGGKYPIMALPENLQLDPALYSELTDIIKKKTVGFDTANAQDALSKLFGIEYRRAPDGALIQGKAVPQIPNASEIKLLEEIFGVQFASAIEPLRQPSLRQNLLDVLNIPRALIASGDISYTLRQGLLGFFADPVIGAKTLLTTAKAYASPKFADEVTNLALGVAGTERQKAVSKALIDWGMDVVSGPTSADELFRTGLWGQRLFKSNEAGRILRASDRSFSTAGNFQRWEMGQKLVNDWVESLAKSRGVDLSQTGVYESLLKEIPPEIGSKIAKTLNVMTGRTNWKRLTSGDLGQVLNAGFFSPGFFLSRIEAPTNLVSGVAEAARRDPRLLLSNAGRQELYRSDPTLSLYAKALGGMIATGAGVYGAASLAGADFTLDPRATDFGKVKIGETRVDPWGGYAPLVRQLAQVITGERITSRGAEVPTDRIEVVQNFLRSKLSPTLGFGWNAITGQNFNNREVTFERDSLESQVASAMVPLFIQDMVNGFKNGGVGSAALSSLSTIGAGVQSYRSIPEIRDAAAYRITGGRVKNFEDLNGPEKMVVNQDPDVIKAIAEYETSVPANSYSSAIQQIMKNRDDAQNFNVSQLANKYITRKQFSDRMSDIIKKASIQRGQALLDYGIPDQAAPSSALQQGLKDWRDLYKQADEGYANGIETGNINWDKFEELEKDLKNRLSPEQWQFIQERYRYEGNDNTKWWFDNRQYVNESTDFYKVADKYFDKYKSRLQAIDPSIDTYGRLLSYLDATKQTNVALYNRLNAIAKPIKSQITTERERMRRADPVLDASLYTLGRVNTLLTPKAKSFVGDWLDSDTGKPDQ